MHEILKPAYGIPVAIPDKPIRLLDQFRAWLRCNNYRYQTVKTYVHWATAYIRFHKRRHPKEMGAAEIEALLLSVAAVLARILQSNTLPYLPASPLTPCIQDIFKHISLS